jgi:hypothetical protein
MTERKTGGRLAIFHKLNAGDVPAPWVPPELPASKDATGRALAARDRTTSPPAPWVPPELPVANTATGRALAKRDRTASPPAPWVPAELPAVSSPATAAPAVAKSDRAVAKLTPWVPPAEAPRNLPTTVAADLPATVDETPEPKKRKKKGKRQAVETTAEIHQAGPTTINIVNQVAAPAPVFYGPWWGGWGGCPHAYCPRRAGRTCWRLWCWW